MSMEEKLTGRNEACPCGSGKKYKRCHGVGAAPKLSVPAAPPQLPGGGGMPGFDPSQLDPKMLMQFSQALQRLPRGQMQRLQAMMQKAMAGKDVSQEAAEFERTLPPGFQEMMKGMMPAPEMTAEQARAIVEKATAEGKVSAEQAESLLSAAPAERTSLWKKLTGKK